MVNPNHSGRKYQFTYGVGMPESYLAGSILKMDVVKKEFVKIWEDKDCMATEPQFVPRSKICAFFPELSDCDFSAKLKPQLLRGEIYCWNALISKM